MTRYDDATPQLWKIPLRDDVQPGTSVIAPRGGYIVPSAQATAVAAQLALHGIDFRRFGRGVEAFDVERFGVETAEFAAGSVEGRQRLTVTDTPILVRSACFTRMSIFVPVIISRRVNITVFTGEPGAGISNEAIVRAGGRASVRSAAPTVSTVAAPLPDPIASDAAARAADGCGSSSATCDPSGSALLMIRLLQLAER
jgi:hypothetical protein